MAKILIADDERDVVTLIRFILEREGHVIDEAYNGLEVLQKLGLEPQQPVSLPDLIIMDVMMPMMDGYTAATKMREHAETRSIPLLILTAKGQMRDVFQLSHNISAYIEKPFDPKALRDLISGILSGAKKAGA
ncbi:MAG: response regulator [Elusimicrobia bacterium]|nr:response regulator [Elusimicrobiota bacterium]